MQLHFGQVPGTGYREIVSPRTAPSEGLELALVRLGPGEALDRQEVALESVLVILGGRVAVTLDGQMHWDGLGGRENVFAGLATAVYVPPGCAYRLESQNGAEIAVCHAPAEAGPDPYVVLPRDVRYRTVGRDSWRRDVCDIVGEAQPAARLLVGETYNEPGGWSSYPPHKHDVHDPPQEARLQEVYHYRVQPGGGFGLQRIYSPARDFDQTYTVQDGDTVFIPFGYHPVVAAAGYRLYYLWALAGSERAMRPRTDPRYADARHFATPQTSAARLSR